MFRQLLFIILTAFLFIPYLFCDDNIYSLSEIKVKANVIKPTKQEGDTLFTGTEILNITGASQQNSIYDAISILPSINLDSDDPFGLGDKRLRIRGTSDYYIGVTINGIPEYGIMPIGPRDYIFDMENMEKIKVFTGSAPADLMSGSGNRGGAIELSIKKPNDKLSYTFHQDIGSFNYSKTFFRFDTGNLKTGSKFFISGSYTDANKWKGEGKLGPRKNISFGFYQSIKNNINFEIYANYNSFNRHLFKGLNYSQAKDLDKYYYHDYNSQKTGNPLIDWNYYGYNRMSGINRDYFGIFNFKLSKTFNLKIKPYYSKENNSKYEGMGSQYFSIVINKINNSKRYGFITEVQKKFNNWTIIAGNWFEKTDFNPIIKKYSPGETLKFKGYSWFTKTSSRGKMESPYLKLSYKLKKLKAQMGIKYFYYKEPGKKGYWYKNGEFIYDPFISIKEKDYDVWLPSFGIGYKFSEKIEIDLSYSKRYQRPYAYGPLSSFYFKNFNKFSSKNIKLQDLFDNLDMEKVHAFDFIIRNKFKKLTITTDFFYQKHKNVLVSLFDPRVGLSYFQNDGEAKSKGVEINLNYKILSNLNFLINGSYTKMEFSKNINRGDTIYKVDGKQFPDTPKYMLKTSMNYYWKNFEVSPYIELISKRYGDALNKEEIPGYGIVNLNLNYFYKKIELNLEIKNLLNKKHIGRIYTWDDSTGTTTYYSGSPFTAIFKIKVNF